MKAEMQKLAEDCEGDVEMSEELKKNLRKIRSFQLRNLIILWLKKNL